MNRITYKLSGRLGNHLQLWACARTLSLRYGWEFLYRPIIHAKEFSLAQAYGGKQAGLLTPLLALARGNLLRMSDHSWDESGFMSGKATPSFRAQAGKLMILDWGGIFRHVTEFRTQLISELLGDHNRRVPLNPDARSVGVHIRRDDTQYPQPISYYVNAIKQAEADVGAPLALHLFSDGDIEALAGQIRNHLPANELVLHRGGVVEDMLQLAGFQCLVISMSWFSYWAAYLSHGARIYCPEEFQYHPDWLPISGVKPVLS
jgi:hypothetical protein